MMNIARDLAVVLAVGLVALVPQAVRGKQPSELNRLYSQGVNAYFAGRSSEAESSLSQALALEAQDPRIYYFRALSLLRLGRLDEARGDMIVGASVEAQHPQRFAVGKALERVQGGHRLILERYRREARSSQQVALKPTQPGQRVLRQPPQVKNLDEHVLRQRIVIPLDRLLGPGSPQPLSAEELSQRARQALEMQATPQPTREAGGAVVTTDDPFRDDPTRSSVEEAAATPPPAVDPVRPPDVEAEDMPDGEVTPQADDVPEAETPEADDDPFGGL